MSLLLLLAGTPGGNAANLAVTLDASTLSADAKVLTHAASAAALSSATLSSTVAITTHAAGAATLAAASLTSAGALRITASGAGTLGATLAAAGAIKTYGAANAQLDSAGLNSGVAIRVGGGLSATLDAAILSASMSTLSPATLGRLTSSVRRLENFYSNVLLPTNFSASVLPLPVLNVKIGQACDFAATVRRITTLTAKVNLND